jgi:hypothetical protein
MLIRPMRLAAGGWCAGHLPEREVQTGIGTVAVKVPRVRDRAPEGGQLKFTSTILPPHLRRAVHRGPLPWLYLKGISTGDFQSLAASCWDRCTWFVRQHHHLD